LVGDFVGLSFLLTGVKTTESSNFLGFRIVLVLDLTGSGLEAASAGCEFASELVSAATSSSSSSAAAFLRPPFRRGVVSALIGVFGASFLGDSVAVFFCFQLLLLDFGESFLAAGAAFDNILFGRLPGPDIIIIIIIKQV